MKLVSYKWIESNAHDAKISHQVQELVKVKFSDWYKHKQAQKEAIWVTEILHNVDQDAKS